MKNKKKIKIAVLIDAWYPFIGGGQIHVDKLTHHMSNWCEFKIFHANSESLASRIIWSLKVIFEVIDKNRSSKFDLIHAHAFLPGLPGKILAKLLKIPVIYTVHGCHNLDLFELKKNHPNLIIKLQRWKYLLEKWLLTRIKYDYQISLANNFLQFPNINKNISIIPNGVDIKEFNNVLISKRIKFTIIFLGKEDNVKGLKYLEEAFQKVKKEYPDIELLKILGSYKDRTKLVKVYKSSHLFVLPSLAEGQPISLLEAWAAKLPVIVTKVGDNKELVIDGKNGYLVEPADVQELKDAIIKAIKNPKLEEMGIAGYNLVKEKYTWKISAKKTLNVYKEVLNGLR